MQSPLRWSEDASWKLDYNNVAQMSPEELARRRREFDRQKEIARGNRVGLTPAGLRRAKKQEQECHQENVHVTRPFEGVKILDFTQVLAGPYASYQLALLGADVIKVERREGEDMRRTPLSREWAERGLAPGWQAINGNKRSLTLDLQKPEAITIVKQLAAQRRRGDGEFPARRDGQARHRLCRAVGDQSAADLLRHLGLRPDRPGTIGRGL